MSFNTIPTTRFHLMLLRKYNIWYSVCDGNWSNPQTWVSNSRDKKNFKSPQPGDTVYVNHNINFDINATVTDLYIQGKLSSTVNNLTLSVNGDLQAAGTIDFTSNNTTLNLYGYNNIVNSFTAGNSTVGYWSNGAQNVMNLNYEHLFIGGLGGTKYLTGNQTIAGNLNVNAFAAGAGAILECGSYNLTVNGATDVTFANFNGIIYNYGLSKMGSGTMLFIGSVYINCNIHITSAVTSIEFRDGLSGGGYPGIIQIDCPVSFTTNSQTLSCSSVTFNSTVTVSGAITLTTSNTSGMTFNGVVNGDNANSTINNTGWFITGTTTIPMATGIFNYMFGASSTMDYSCNATYTLPYTTYNNLKIHGSGIKYLAGNTTCLNLNISDFQPPPDANLECGAYNLTINGAFTIAALSGGALSKSGSGTILFVGSAYWNAVAPAYNAGITLEFRGGATFSFVPGSNIIDATINFTTANQTFSTASAYQLIINGAINIAPDITVSVTGNNNGILLNGAVNGLSSTSIWQMNSGTLTYNNATAPMVTGQLYCNKAGNTWIYGASGNQDVTMPSDPIPGYQNLILQGSGAKRLLGNVSVKGTYTLTSPATLNSNGFALTNP